jgi:uncharacterized membrane protein YedE/YeeE
MAERLAGGSIGIGFGITLCWSGMSDPRVVRDALLFEDSYLFLMFASAVLVAAVGLRVLGHVRQRALLTDAAIECPRVRPARRHVVGSVLFGTGWGVAAACPGPIATQVGQGIPWALFTLTGVVAGVYLFLRKGAEETEPATDRFSPAPAPAPR